MLCDKCMVILSDVLSIKMNEKLGKVSYAGVFNVEIERPEGNVHKLVVLANDYNYCYLCGKPIDAEGSILVNGVVDIDPVKDKVIFDLLDTVECNEDNLDPMELGMNESYDPYQEDQSDIIDSFKESNFETIAETYTTKEEE